MAGYPEVSLLGYVDGEVVPDTVAGLQELVAQLLRARGWAGAPPEFVDSIDAGGVRTCGVVLWLTDVRASTAETVSAELDRSELADAKAVVDALAGFSGRTGLTVSIEYGGESIGWIEAGRPDEGIREGLIGEWERGIAG
ncbi:hypothetical protein AB0M46_12175 [Dactylosporangium sp. NPDC051485]|uniref:hypothetical protein n=1 Tax=Dactylosporangium sp. NPDC051485 TaxID=3154846 RepID=UPI00344AB8EC